MPALPKNITRTTYGYRVSLQRAHHIHVKYFSHLQYGSLSAALSAAKQYLAGLRQNLTTTPSHDA